MAEEAVTTLRAELDRFERAEIAFALLETFLEVAGPWLGSAELDPDGLVLPDEMSEDRAVVQGLIEEIEREPKPARRLLTNTERAYDVAEPQARWDFTRLAYCSTLATVWSPGNRTTFFESVDRARATYWLPDSLKDQYFAALSAKRWQIPEDWLAAIPKQPKPWWKRGRS